MDLALLRTPHGCWRVFHWDPPAKLSPKIMTTKAGPAPPGAGSHGQIRTVGLLTVVVKRWVKTGVWFIMLVNNNQMLIMLVKNDGSIIETPHKSNYTDKPVL